jgi:hypothetical protein
MVRPLLTIATETIIAAITDKAVRQNASCQRSTLLVVAAIARCKIRVRGSGMRSAVDFGTAVPTSGASTWSLYHNGSGIEQAGGLTVGSECGFQGALKTRRRKISRLYWRRCVGMGCELSRVKEKWSSLENGNWHEVAHAMSGEPLLDEGATVERVGGRPGLVRRVADRLLHEVLHAVPPTVFFFVGFNLIVLTTNLLVAQYLVAVSNFMLATVAALVVGKAVLVANNLPLIRHYDRAPLVQPILFKTAVYWIIVFIARLLERFVHFLIIERNSPFDFGAYLLQTFSWSRFIAISLWILVLFLIYVTATEFSQLFGPGEIVRLLFTRRPSDLQLNRRQRMRELLRLSRLADAHSANEFRDPRSAPHKELVDIVSRLARKTHLRDGF